MQPKQHWQPHAPVAHRHQAPLNKPSARCITGCKAGLHAWPWRSTRPHTPKTISTVRVCDPRQGRQRAARLGPVQHGLVLLGGEVVDVAVRARLQPLQQLGLDRAVQLRRRLRLGLAPVLALLGAGRRARAPGSACLLTAASVSSTSCKATGSHASLSSRGRPDQASLQQQT